MGETEKCGASKERDGVKLQCGKLAGHRLSHEAYSDNGLVVHRWSVRAWAA